jgi:hypothetical protein
MTVRELLATTDSRELSEWMVYSNLEYWEERFAKQAREAQGPASSDLIIGTLFGGGNGGK